MPRRRETLENWRLAKGNLNFRWLSIGLRPVSADVTSSR
jgi:hypothetical protein